MNKPARILTTPELEQCKRDGIRIMKAAYYMRLENGGILEVNASPCNRCASAWAQRFIFGDPESRS